MRLHGCLGARLVAAIGAWSLSLEAGKGEGRACLRAVCLCLRRAKLLRCCQRQPAMTSDWPVILAFIVARHSTLRPPNTPATPLLALKTLNTSHTQHR